jgi:hypothetical protein
MWASGVLVRGPVCWYRGAGCGMLYQPTRSALGSRLCYHDPLLTTIPLRMPMMLPCPLGYPVGYDILDTGGYTQLRSECSHHTGFLHSRCLNYGMTHIRSSERDRLVRPVMSSYSQRLPVPVGLACAFDPTHIAVVRAVLCVAVVAWGVGMHGFDYVCPGWVGFFADL